ncbi:unnamed protein product, partial [Iphiclides podalirius]
MDMRHLYQNIEKCLPFGASHQKYPTKNFALLNRYSAEENRSRIDFYDGTVRRYYQIDPDNDTLAVYQISPITTDAVTNEIICRSIGDDDESSIDNLPSVDDLVYQGNETLDGKVVQVWKSIEEEDDRNERTLYVYRDNRGFDVPVRYEDIQYNTWSKGMDKHTITNFYDFKTIVSPEDLDVGEVEECQDLGKLGENLKIDLDFLHPVFSRDVHRAFQSYKKHFNKKHREDEHWMRRAIFEENWKLVVAHNRKNLSYKLEVNKFADRLDEELGHLTATRPSPPGAVGTHPYPYSEEDLLAMVDQLPICYDMTFDGVLSRVKNQGSCGSCWAFATVAAVEGALARSNGGRVFDLSEQSLVDCAWGDNFGCGGGEINGAFKYVYTNGIPSEKNYGPYLQQDGFCKLENMSAVHNIRGFAKVPSLSETAMKAALYNFAPVTVVILASHHMMLYSTGVFYDIDCVEGEYNHDTHFHPGSSS